MSSSDIKEFYVNKDAKLVLKLTNIIDHLSFYQFNK